MSPWNPGGVDFPPGTEPKAMKENKMDEQRRVYLAIVLSVVVLMGWQMIMGHRSHQSSHLEAPTEGISERPACHRVMRRRTWSRFCSAR